jgi:hypothetical protein
MSQFPDYGFMLTKMGSSNMEHLREESRLKRLDSQRALLLEEFREGIWSRDEYRKKVRKLTKTGDASTSATQQNSHSSPEWDTEIPSSSQ